MDRWSPHLIALALAAALLTTTGCRPATSAPAPPATDSPAQQAAQQSPVPKLPDSVEKADDDMPTGMEIIVRQPTDSRAKSPSYRQDEKCPAGRLVGVVRFSGPVVRREQLPPARKLDTPEALAIPDPKPGEVEYFLNTKLVEERYLHHDFVQPIGVVLMFRDIKAGRRPAVPRTTFLIREGRFRPSIQFAPPHDRIMFATYDSYPTEVEIKALARGRRLADVEVGAYDRSKIRPLGGGGVEIKAPDMAQSEVIHEPGGYELSSRRHAWKRACVMLVDNPYAVVADGKFAVEDVPVGSWKIDVWHPLYRPISPSVEVRIEKDGTTELAVELEPPEYVKAAQEKRN